MHLGDERLMKEETDYIGLQNYTREAVKFSLFIPVLNARIVKADKRAVAAMTNWEIYPESIYHIFVWSFTDNLVWAESFK